MRLTAVVPPEIDGQAAEWLAEFVVTARRCGDRRTLRIAQYLLCKMHFASLARDLLEELSNIHSEAEAATDIDYDEDAPMSVPLRVCMDASDYLHLDDMSIGFTWTT